MKPILSAAFLVSIFLLAGPAPAQDKLKMRIGTHIAISTHLFMQRKPEVLKNMGKTFGVNAIGGTVEQGVRIIARKNGLNVERDLTIVEGRPPFLPAMVRDNKVQAAVLFQPFYEEAMAKGDLKVLFTASDIYGGPTDYVFMAFDDKFLKANGRAVRDYVEDYLRAVNWALDNRAEAVAIYAAEWKLPVSVVDSYLLTKSDYLVRRDGRL